MRTRKTYADRDVSNFDLSISDLMSALCGIFVLIMICVVFKLNRTKAEYNSKNKKAEEYYSMQYDLYLDLTEEFEKKLKEWNAEITSDLTIRFKDTDNQNPMFEADKAILNEKYKKIFADFFPRLVGIISQEKYKDQIDELRIEGHTSFDPSLTSTSALRNKDYKEGMELSQERTREVMLCCLDYIPERREEIQKNIAAIGYSNSRPVNIYEDIDEDRKASRRVEFRIKTRAEKVIEELADVEFKLKHE